MKRCFVLPLLFLSIVVVGKAQVAVGPNDVILDKILPSVVKTPEYSISGPAKRFRNQDWLEVEVQFDTKPELIDELTFRFSILLAGKLITSDDVTYVNIPKGHEHFGVVYVAPRTLDRLTGGKALTGAAIENISVEITRQGQRLAAKSLKNTPLPNVAQIPGMILKKPDSPFAPLYWDRYETLKAPTR